MTPLLAVCFVLAGLALATAGCSSGGSAKRAVRVVQSFEPYQPPHRAQRMTTQAGRRVTADCTLTIVYDVREATGTAVLLQSEVIHLRTRPVPAGTRYAVDCRGPLVVELPRGVSHVRATARSASAKAAAPSVQGSADVPLAFGKRLRAGPGMRLALVSWPRTAATDDKLELGLNKPKGLTLRERVLYTASVSCGGSSYLQPLLPLVDRLSRVPVLTIRPSGKPIAFSPPRIAAGITSHSEATRTLSCRAD
jgi:hypothetical protein